jgi:hypothetical protein
VSIFDFLQQIGQPRQATPQPTPVPTQMMGSIKPTPTPQDPYAVPIANVKQRYPLLQQLPLAVSTGTGPYHSETYFPWEKENPLQGKLNIQLRSDRGIQGRQLEDAIASESLHMLGSMKPDGTPYHPEWFKLKQQLQQSLSPREQKLARDRWQDEQKSGEKRSFQDYLQHSHLDMLIRGYLFPESQGQEWIDRKKRGGWSPQSRAVLDQMHRMLETGK